MDNNNPIDQKNNLVENNEDWRKPGITTLEQYVKELRRVPIFRSSNLKEKINPLEENARKIILRLQKFKLIAQAAQSLNVPFVFDEYLADIPLEDKTKGNDSISVSEVTLAFIRKELTDMFEILNDISKNNLELDPDQRQMLEVTLSKFTCATLNLILNMRNQKSAMVELSPINDPEDVKCINLAALLLEEDTIMSLVEEINKLLIRCSISQKPDTGTLSFQQKPATDPNQEA